MSLGIVDVNLTELQALQVDSFELLADLGFSGRRLENHELVKFGRSFVRQFVKPAREREMVDILQRHKGECLIGAMIAKEQMDAEVDGELPASGKVGGPLNIRAAWFGVGDDWEDILGVYSGAQGTWTTGAAQNWIHSGTTLLAGTDGNAIRIMENAVHVIIGIGTFHAAPKVESMQFTIDGKIKPVLLPFRQQKIGAGGVGTLRIHELDNAIILKKNSTFLAQLFISSAFGAAAANQEDFPYLFGVSFIREDQLRVFDPVNVPGTGGEVVTTT